MTLETSRTLATDAKTQHLCTLVHGEALHQFELLSDDVEDENPLNVEAIILGLASFFFVKFLSKQKCAIRRRMMKPHVLKD